MNKKIAIYAEHPLTLCGGLERVLVLAHGCLSQKGRFALPFLKYKISHFCINKELTKEA